MINIQGINDITNMTIEKHSIIENDYIIFPYPLNFYNIMKDEFWIEETIKKNPNMSYELLSELSKKDIIKIPKSNIILKFVTNFGNNLKNMASSEKTVDKINKRLSNFSKDFDYIYEMHEQRLCSRIIRLNHINDIDAPNLVKKSEERLCAKEAVIMLAFIRVCVPDFDFNDCFIDKDSCVIKK